MAISADLETLTDSELHRQTVELAKKEQQTTIELLHHLYEVERRKLHAQKGYASLWEYVQKALSYSETQTSERISAMRCMFRAPEVKKALETGKLTLTQAALAERHLRGEERSQEKKILPKDVSALVSQIEGLSKRETEKVLLSESPSPKLPSERIRPLTPELNEVKFTISEETHPAMERFWALTGRCSVSELLSTCLEFYLDQKDPQRKLEMKPAISPGR